MLQNMAVSLLKHEQIKTTLPKAKVLRPFVEKLITKARTNSLTTVRSLMSTLQDQPIVRKLIDKIAPRFATRPGGYTRIYKLGSRYGDAAPMALIELTEIDKDAYEQSRIATKPTSDSNAVADSKQEKAARAEQRKTHHKKEFGSTKVSKTPTVRNRPNVVRRSASSSSGSGG
jgi:large subunit ribosomal protein L17